MSETTEIETGYETSNDRIRTTEYEVEAFADDGEYATCWMVREIDKEHIEVATIRCEAGLRKQDGPVEVFDVPSDKTAVQFAREIAQVDPEEAVELARQYWG